MKKLAVIIPVLLITAMGLWAFMPGGKTGNKDKSNHTKYTAMDAAAAKELLLKADLPSLITSNNKDNGTHVYNGFQGKDHYRVEFYIAKVTADKQNPYLLTVEGKTRYKKKVTPFTGQIQFESVKQNLQTDQTVYQAKGTFTMTQTNINKSVGTYTGDVYMDFAKVAGDGNGTYELIYGDDETHGSNLLMSGTYTADGNKQDVMVGRYLFAFANDILTDFYYGGRARSINTKYRALGWDDYWQHPEWWADEKTSSL